ncbi:hypothetical protein TYRP_004287 [Tyrophagus putrescentiae]|nr:hypothetical protein TYRP_004287 [Tyrophagus putrescentiae]
MPLIEEIQVESLHLYVYDIFPMTTKCLEHFLIENQLVGLKCLHLLLTHKHADDEQLNCFEILKKNGYDQFVYLRLRHMLYSTNKKTFDLLMKNLHLVLVESLKKKPALEHALKSKNLKTMLDADQKLDEVFGQLVENLYTIQAKPVLIQKHLQAMQMYLFPLMKCSLLKFTMNLLNALDGLLDHLLQCELYDILETGFLVLHDFLSNINGNLASEDCTIILKRLLKSILKLQLEQKLQQHEAIEDLTVQILVSLENSSNEAVTKMLTGFSVQVVSSSTIWEPLETSSKLAPFFKQSANSKL